MKSKPLITALFLACSGSLYSQAPAHEDSLRTQQLEELVVTATRNERVMGALPMPVSLVPKQQIRQMGSLRLNDVLTEQTGLVVVPQVNGQGNGIQIQGFNPDYTLILIDGEPVIGRNTGSLDLSRLTVGNIKQVEIVKGPSSSLYGSEALAGVVNIITEQPQGRGGKFYSRYGTNNTLDLSGDVNWTNEKLGVFLFADRYSSSGYDLTPETVEKTVSPFYNYTLNSRITYKLSSKTDLSLSGRYFDESQRSHGEGITSTNEISGTSGSGAIVDWNINPVLTHRFSNRLKTVARFYATRYQSEDDTYFDLDGSLYYHDDYDQSFIRPEINSEYFINDRNVLTLGTGYIWEAVQTSRFGDDRRRRLETGYGFFQHEWLPHQKLNVILGGRYDNNSVYGSQFSPKLSARYELNDRVSLKVSGGSGFKAPDFRQLYLNFDNSSSGYTVLGTEVVTEKLAELELQGQIQEYSYDPTKIGDLQAERSKAVNAGGTLKLLSSLSIDLNGFYNYTNNLIESQIVATTTAGRTIYSYRNVNRSYFTGLETNLNYTLLKNISVSAGYQLLYAMDRDVLESIKAGEQFYRDPYTLVTRRLKSSEYFGLYNRSRHNANIKFFYSHPATKWEASLRVIYRGKFATRDSNSNAFLDKYDEFIDGYAQVNLSVAKTLKQNVRFQAGVDNLLNYQNPTYIQNIPGRLMYGSVSYSFSKNHVKPN